MGCEILRCAQDDNAGFGCESSYKVHIYESAPWTRNGTIETLHYLIFTLPDCFPGKKVDLFGLLIMLLLLLPRMSCQAALPAGERVSQKSSSSLLYGSQLVT